MRHVFGPSISTLAPELGRADAKEWSTLENALRVPFCINDLSEIQKTVISSLFGDPNARVGDLDDSKKMFDLSGGNALPFESTHYCESIW